MSTPDRLTARYFVKVIPSSEKKAKPMKRCAVYCKTSGKRKEKHHFAVRTTEYVCALWATSRSTTLKPLSSSK
jgi:predicted lipoprotein